MISIDTLLTFSVAATLLSISPGPSNLYIVARTMASGARHGVAAASGMAIGSIIYVLATAFGLAAVFVLFPMSFLFLKLGGALYLIYLGIGAFIKHKNEKNQSTELKAISVSNVFKQSIWVELTNPKTALFFMAFLPLFVDPNAGPVATQLILLGCLYSIIAFCSDLFMVFISNLAGKWLSTNQSFVRWQDRISGSILIGLGLVVLYDVGE